MNRTKTICIIYFDHATHIVSGYALVSTQELKYVY